MTVSTQNLHISLGGTEILKGIDFHTKQHSFVGIIGPNGSGKSTLLKCIYRTLKPTSGAVLLDDVFLRTLSLKQSAKKIAVVAQHNHYNFDFTVKDVVMLGRAPHKRMLDRDTRRFSTGRYLFTTSWYARLFRTFVFLSVRRRTAEGTVGSRSGAADALFDFR